MNLKPKVEAIIYAAEEPVSVEQIAALLKEAVVSGSSEQLTPAQIKAAIRSTIDGRKAIVGRPILFKTTKSFLMRSGLIAVGELPSMEEFEKLAGEALRSEGFDDVFDAAGVPDATGVPDVPEAVSEAHSHSED